MSTPVRDSTSASLSANGSPSRRARARPTAVLPEPIGPIRKTLRFVGCKRGLSPLAPRHYGQHRPFAKGDCPLLLPPPPPSRQRGASPLAKGRVPFGKETAARRRPLGWARARRDHSIVEPSRRIFGVTKISNSSRLLILLLVLNRLPTTGTSPRPGTFLTESRRSVSMMPPSTTVWPSFTSTWVWMLRVSIEG